MWEHVGWVKETRENRQVERVKEHRMIIENIIFWQPPRRLWTWKYPGDNIRNQIDYAMINTRFRNSLISCKTYPGADCYSDHVPIISKARLKLKKLRNTRKESLMGYAMLNIDPELRRLYSAEVRNKFEALQVLDSIEKQRGKSERVYQQNCTENYPRSEKKRKTEMDD